MDVKALQKRFSGEILANKLRVNTDKGILIMARLVKNEWEMTPEGEKHCMAVNEAEAIDADADAPAVGDAGAGADGDEGGVVYCR